jgi:rhomboid family GlyGly-CTERM serine protease
MPPGAAAADRGAVWWCAVAAVLAAGALAAHGRPASPIDWQPALAWSQPWRWWSAAWVHYSAMHLGANLAGAALVAALGVADRVPRRAAVAWLLAWPLTHVALLLAPSLRHYGGLSGVLHAGVGVIAVDLLRSAPAQRRRLGAMLLAGLAVKIASEAPWAAAVQQPAGWDIATAPVAHLAGAIAGAAVALCVVRPARAMPPSPG